MIPQLRESLKLHQHPDDDWQNNGPYYDNGNSRGGQRRQDSGPYSSGYWDDAVSSVAPDDITGFYTVSAFTGGVVGGVAV